MKIAIRARMEMEEKAISKKHLFNDLLFDLHHHSPEDYGRIVTNPSFERSTWASGLRTNSKKEFASPSGLPLKTKRKGRTN